MESEKKDSALVRSSAAEYLTFVASTGEDKDSIEMRYEDENIWLTQKMMATLYDVGLPTINEHIKKIYADHEQDEAATIRKFRIVQNEGGRQVTCGRLQGEQPASGAVPCLGEPDRGAVHHQGMGNGRGTPEKRRHSPDQEIL